MKMKTTPATAADLRKSAADYNPRKISQEELSRLKKCLDEYGDLSGIVVNLRTGNMVGGHQRTKTIPENAVIERTETYQTPTRTGTVSHGFILINDERYAYREVDWDITREKAANLAANANGGEFDDESFGLLIKELSLDADFDCELIGFDFTEVENILKNIATDEAAQEKKDKQLKDKIHELYEVIIECSSEQEQEIIFNKIKEEGYRCRLLTL